MHHITECDAKGLTMTDLSLLNISVPCEVLLLNSANTLELIESAEDRLLFVRVFKDHEFLKYGSGFIKDINRRWVKTGTLSMKQIEVALRIAKEFDANKKAMAAMLPYRKDDEILVERVSVESIVEVDLPSYCGHIVRTNEVKLKHESGAIFIIKTNAKKLLTVFEDALTGKISVDVFAVVKFVNETKPIVHLSAKGAKVLLDD